MEPKIIHVGHHIVVSEDITLPNCAIISHKIHNQVVYLQASDIGDLIDALVDVSTSIAKHNIANAETRAQSGYDHGYMDD